MTTTAEPSHLRRDGRSRPAPAGRSPLASGSVRVHLLRGVIGVVAAVGAIVLARVVGPVALLLFGVTVVAWRGCPTCWTVGLMGTLADDRARRGCDRC